MSKPVQNHKKNFQTLVAAVKSDNAVLFETMDTILGEKVACICAVNQEGDEMSLVPFAAFHNGNPYSRFLPALPDGGFPTPSSTVLVVIKEEGKIVKTQFVVWTQSSCKDIITREALLEKTKLKVKANQTLEIIPVDVANRITIPSEDELAEGQPTC